MKKPTHVYLKLSGHWFLMPYIAERTALFVAFGTRAAAMLLPRSDAAAILRRLRSWGGGSYYKAEVVKP